MVKTVMGVILNLENIGVTGIFKRRATRDVLLLLEKNSFQRYSVRELHRELEGRHSLYSVQRTAEELERAGLLNSHMDGRRKMVGIAQERVYEPHDPYSRIPQTEFRSRIRSVAEEVRKRVRNVHAIILFGSFSRGDADRMSDMDFLLLVKSLRGVEKSIAALEGSIARGEFLDERFRVNTIIETLSGAADLLEKNPAVARALREGIILYQDDSFRTFSKEVRI